MAGHGPPPKAPGERRRRNPPARGEWRPTPNVGWQFRPFPDPPEIGLRPESIDAWNAWFKSWFAAHWTPDDLPGLRIVIGLYDLTVRWIDEPLTVHTSQRGAITVVPNPNPTTELRQLMVDYGITHKGQQDRRWSKPEREAPVKRASAAGRAAASNPYAHLRVVGE